MNFPTDSVQRIVDTWWEKCEPRELRRGALLYAFVPHVDQVPLTLKPIGRKEPYLHDKGTIIIDPLKINDARPREALPVAALSLHEGELWTAYRAKKRPCMIMAIMQPEVDKSLRRGMPKKSTAPTLIVAPYYGADRDGRRAGYNPALIERIRHAEYPQFMLDILPVPGPENSILRFEHIQPIGLHDHSYEHTGFSLSDEAVEIILDDWLQWFFYGGLPKGSIILDFQKAILSAYSC